MSESSPLPPLSDLPWHTRLSVWAERVFARVTFGVYVDLTRWDWRVWGYSAGWLENRVEITAGPLLLTMQYYRDPAAALAQQIRFFRFPRGENAGALSSARIRQIRSIRHFGPRC